MSNIGKLTRNDNGTVSGFVAEPHYDFDIFLGRVESEEADAPNFQLMTKSPRGRDVPLGFIWQDKGQESGEIYFRGYFKSGQSGYVRLHLLRSRDESNVWNVVRRDAQNQRRRRPAPDATLPEPAAPKRQRKAKAPANDATSGEQQAA